MAEKRDAGVDPRFDPVFQRGYDPTRHRTRVVARVETPVVEPVETSAVVRTEVSAGATTDPEPPVRNPFRLILLLASVAAIAGAALLLWYRLTTDPYYYASPSSDQWALFADALIPAALAALTTGGIIGLAAWLAIGALRGRHRE